MNILVFIGPAIVYPDPIRDEPRLLGSETWMSEPDRRTLETALALRDVAGSGTVTVVAAGPDRIEVLLREALAAGADRAIRFWLPPAAGWDGRALARLVAEQASGLSADVAVVRNRTSDIESCLIGAFLIETDGFTGVTSVVDVRAVDDTLEVDRVVEQEVETVKCRLPAALAIERGDDLRYPTLPDRLRAKEATIPVVSGDAAASVDVDRITLPKPLRRPAIDRRPGEERAMEHVMGVGGAGGSLIEGDPADVARELADFLRAKLRL